MGKCDKNKLSAPCWFVVVLIVMTLPLLLYPVLLDVVHKVCLLGINPDMFKFILYAMPLYIVVSQFFSYKQYTQWPALAWVLQLLLLAVYLMCGWLVYQVNYII